MTAPELGAGWVRLSKPRGRRRSRHGLVSHYFVSPSGAEFRSFRAALDAALSAEYEAKWVMCEACEKWRKLPPGAPAPGADERWTCSMNEDPLRNSCEAEEVRWKHARYTHISRAYSQIVVRLISSVVRIILDSS